MQKLIFFSLLFGTVHAFAGDVIDHDKFIQYRQAFLEKKKCTEALTDDHSAEVVSPEVFSPQLSTMSDFHPTDLGPELHLGPGEELDLNEGGIRVERRGQSMYVVTTKGVLPLNPKHLHYQQRLLIKILKGIEHLPTDVATLSIYRIALESFHARMEQFHQHGHRLTPVQVRDWAEVLKRSLPYTFLLEGGRELANAITLDIVRRDSTLPQAHQSMLGEVLPLMGTQGGNG